MKNGNQLLLTQIATVRQKVTKAFTILISFVQNFAPKITCLVDIWFTLFCSSCQADQASSTQLF